MKRAGHIFQVRFKSILIEKDSHLLELTRYIVLNTVRAKMVRSPRECRWSSYRASAGHLLGTAEFVAQSATLLNEQVKDIEFNLMSVC
ncbi:hypothetical protein KAH43_03280 [Candidatus Bipolaricaulota bacterium]|nr:hypothetical protein [Candidatus Bipolaricaulota bacterium]